MAVYNKGVAPSIDANVVFEYEEIRIENTNHCGYKCYFCPRDELTREKGYMGIDDFNLILSRLPYYSNRVDLHGFGEPLLDQSLPEKLKILTSRWPEAQSRIISTLGLKLSQDYVDDLISSGLGILEVSFYGINKETYQVAHGVNKFDLAIENIKLVLDANKRLNGKLDIYIREFPAHDDISHSEEHKLAQNRLDAWFKSIGVKRISQHKMHNYGGGRNYNTPPQEGLCSVVWGYRKRVLQITWDLDVIPCCFDSNSSVIFGNLRDQTLTDIFTSQHYSDFIDAHKKNILKPYPVCANCERCFKP